MDADCGAVGVGAVIDAEVEGSNVAVAFKTADTVGAECETVTDSDPSAEADSDTSFVNVPADAEVDCVTCAGTECVVFWLKVPLTSDEAVGWSDKDTVTVGECEAVTFSKIESVCGSVRDQESVNDGLCVAVVEAVASHPTRRNASTGAALSDAPTAAVGSGSRGVP